MEKETFLEEEKKLKSTVDRIAEEEREIEDVLSKTDMNYDMENLAKGLVLQMYVNKLENMKKVKNNPYFARMDFQEKDKDKEIFYIGKISLLDSKTLEPIIVDWRAPISNLYYEGKIGSASYNALGEKIEGEISLKRQYIIENQKLKKYVDINVTGNDELLQNALEEKADDRLKNIVATIQDEQNKIIRAPIDAPLIVQGVAGSGKTTIALHRIAYLIYNYEKEFRPDEFMIIAPTKFFLNYISNILPDLGVNDVKQYTFEDFAYDVIGKRLRISDNNEKLVMIVNNDIDDDYKEKIDIILQESKLKSSIKFKEIIDEYLKYVENNYIPKIDFMFNEYKIMDYKEINELFIDVYKMYSFSTRINEIEKNLTYELRKKSDEIIEDLKTKRSNAIKDLQGDARVKLYEDYEKVIKQIEKDYKKIVKNYLKQMPNKTSIDYYRDFLENYIGQMNNEKTDEINQSNRYVEETNSGNNNDNQFKSSLKSLKGISNEVITYLRNSTLVNLQKNEVAFEDLAPIMYLQYKILGIKEKCRVKHVVIDEAQDYGEFQFDVLKTILNSNSMTILGDLAQGVHYYRGIENWKRFIDVEFSNTKVTYTTLKKTYRTTKDIMNVANSVISKLPDYEKEFIVLGEPVIDRKDSINIQKCSDFHEVINIINSKIDKYLSEGYKSIAIIGKDMEECKKIQKNISMLRSDVKLIQGKDSEYNAGISIVPSYVAKGLEFDCVMIANASNTKYTKSSLDTKLLYVTITRAMSKLDILYADEISELLR